MATQFGEKVRQLRERRKLLLRQVASKLDIDSSIVSKIERGTRPIRRNQISLLAEILQADENELLTLWLADQVYDVIKNEPVATEALKKVSDKIRKSK